MRIQDFRRIAVLALIAVTSSPGLADCGSVWYTGWTNNTLGSSFVYGNQVQREVADDFEYVGSVVRLLVSGSGPFPNQPTPLQGAWIRFYAWTPNGPGALQRQEYLTANDPNLGVLPTPSTVDIRLATPFAASGRHYVSVQLDYPPSGGYWEPWVGSSTPPMLSRAWVRDQLAGGSWGPHLDFQGNVVDRDMSFELYGEDGVATCQQVEEMPTPVPNPAYSILRDVDLLSASDGWAVGHHEALVAGATESHALALRRSGSNWLSVPIPSPSPYPGGGNVQLWAVAGLSANDAWAGGTQRMQVNGGWVNQQLLVEHWDGSAWTVMNAPLPPTSVGAGYGGAHVYDIAALSANDVWFVGRWVGPYPGTSSTQPPLTMHWDGNDFELVPAPVLGGSCVLEAISAVSPSDIWAVGNVSSATTPYPYVLHWDGSLWSHVVIPPAGVYTGVVDVLALSASEVWVSAYRATTSGNLPVLLRFNGTSWSQTTPPVASSAIFGTSANDLYLASDRLHHFDGSTWEVLTGPDCVASPSFADLDGAAGELVAVGRQLGAGLVPLAARRSMLDCDEYTYCTSSVTMNGCVATISAVGTASASAASGYTLRVGSVEGQRQGLIFYGIDGQLALPWFSGSTSYLCVKSPVQRLPAQSSGGVLGTCSGVLARDWNLFMANTPSALGQPRIVGQTFDAQAWFRDPPSPKTTNLSNAIHFTLAP